MSNQKPYLIGIAGGSGSGKTTVVNTIIDKIGKEIVVVLKHDWYYKHHPQLSLEERALLNYDHPDALETTLMIDHLKELIGNRHIMAPLYDYGRHLRKKETQLIKPKEVIILDGILILVDDELRKLMDLKAYVDADADHRFIRRLKRDVNERGRSLESIVEQYLNTVKPMHDAFVENSKRYANIIIPNGGENSPAIELIITKINSVLRRAQTKDRPQSVVPQPRP